MNNVYKSHNFKRGFEWDWIASREYSKAADASLQAVPLQSPPPISNDKTADYALRTFPHLFKIVCPINIAKFELLLNDHPNQPFVKSVLDRLHNGFWPMSEIPDDEVVINKNHSICNQHPDLLRTARNEEVAAERYSPGFQKLAPGMIISPLLLVAKKGTSKMRVCTDMSYRKPSLNDLVIKDKIRVAFDSLISFAPHMVELKKQGKKLYLWKTDAARAYQNMPIHTQYQLRQIVCINNQYHMDHCTNFGSSASPKIWCSFFSLVLWIAVHKFGIKQINNLMDDTWGICTKDEFTTFKDVKMPLDQAKFLYLFDILNIPWDWKKQIWGEKIEIIGHYVDASKLSLSLSPEKKSDLITALRTFVSVKQHQLKEWQSLLGWASWGLNTFPLGRFTLQAAWDKIAAKTHRNLLVPTNMEVQRDFRWLADAIEHSARVYLLNSAIWGLSEADTLVASDACPEGIGIWFPNSAEGFHLHLPPPARDIYWAELLAVTYALKVAAKRGTRKIFICTDSMLICNLFHSHRARESVRPLFRFLIHLLVTRKIDIRVEHIPGAKNIFADALSRGELLKVNQLLPTSKVSQITFDPSIPDSGKPPASSLPHPTHNTPLQPGHAARQSRHSPYPRRCM
ncbi:hypothetical protein CROQUDRAFT_679549 [Cronartium quercuum f. sp. fusiforme G11]|uniref:RNase H type-1 domain-containing protein n=1 Tax=Cronartium quercuum f. sp. fusiforme G11 TaxID=708437 RepID=A0A9P6NUL6_9BASI|nr:hypothetical protein CROQUDRAFT_679549 [Cronartium quercuum f. sp. fusiforme G11]